MTTELNLLYDVDASTVLRLEDLSGEVETQPVIQQDSFCTSEMYLSSFTCVYLDFCHFLVESERSFS